jgi:ABC-type oligopeptide transport system substrate-binding subunit
MQTGSSIMGSAATSSNLKPSGTQILERDSSGEKVDAGGSESILISERSSTTTFPKRMERAWVNSNKLKVKRKIECGEFSMIL